MNSKQIKLGQWVEVVGGNKKYIGRKGKITAVVTPSHVEVELADVAPASIVLGQKITFLGNRLIWRRNELKECASPETQTACQ